MSFNNKPDRERVSGVLRFAAQKPNWELRILDSSAESFRADCRQNLADGWRPDACIYSNHRAFTVVLRGLSPIEEYPIRVEIDTEPSKNPPEIAVQLDNQSLISAALELLIRRGYTNVAHFGTTDSAESYYSEVQNHHFVELAKEKQLNYSDFRFNRRDGINLALREASQWIKQLDKPCGIVAYSDNIARDLLDCCRLAQVSVPEQVAIIGIDNDAELCENMRPTLSSIQPDFESSGYLAAEALDRLESVPNGLGSVPNEFSVPQKLTYGIKRLHERASTQDLRGCGRIAAAAQRIIQAEAMTPITVKEIARRLKMSVRLLELDYRKINGRTIKSELSDLRLKTLKERLQTENVSSGEIALACGFKTVNAAQVAFRKRFGCSMNKVRKAR